MILDIMISTVRLYDKMKKIAGKHCSPIDLLQLNDQVIRISYFDGVFHWHKHINQDELFYIIIGKLAIQLKGQPDIVLSEGEMVVIPKGVEHCPKSMEPSYVLLFEPFSLKSKGD
jgi:mannose-6-phosphate isomerase-like protein (cupin superfamily)